MSLAKKLKFIKDRNMFSYKISLKLSKTILTTLCFIISFTTIANSSLNNIDYGSYKSYASSKSYGRDLSEYKIQAKDLVHSIKYFKNIQFESTECNRYQSIMLSLTSSVTKLAQTNSKIDFTKKNFGERVSCLIYGEKDNCDVLQSQKFADYLISKIRFRIILRLLRVQTYFFEKGLSIGALKPNAVLSTSGALKHAYKLCLPRYSTDVVTMSKELLDQSSKLYHSLFQVEGLKTLTRDYKSLVDIKRSYEARRGNIKAATLAATIASTEYIAFAAALRFSGLIHGTSTFNKFFKISTFEATAFGVALGTYDLLSGSESMILNYFKQLDIFQSGIQDFLENDSLKHQDINELLMLLMSEIKASKKILEHKKLNH